MFFLFSVVLYFITFILEVCEVAGNLNPFFFLAGFPFFLMKTTAVTYTKLVMKSFYVSKIYSTCIACLRCQGLLQINSHVIFERFSVY